MVSPGGPNGTAVMGSWNGALWTTLQPVHDLPAPAASGGEVRLLETPDNGRLVALVDARGSPAAAWQWDGVGWGPVTVPGFPARVAAATVDIRDGVALLVGGPDAAHETGSVLAWSNVSMHPPHLGGKAKLEPTFGSPTATPEPVQAIRPLREYALSLAELPRGFGYTAKYGRGGPVPADQAGSAKDTWEVVYEGPGPKLVIVDVYVFADRAVAPQVNNSLGHPSSDTKAAAVIDLPLGDGTAYVWKASVGDGTVEFYAISWYVGRLVFVVTNRDYKGAQTADAVVALARLVDAKAR